MSASARRTVLFGFGRIGAGYAADLLTARHFRYATHGQVLREHPGFDWQAVVDPDEASRAAAKDWGVAHVGASVADIAALKPEVAVLAIPPGARAAIVEQLLSLKAVIVEKPLGATRAESESFMRLCAERGIAVQVNLWRRADRLFRSLADGELARRVGEVQAVTAFYGNGMRNNGTHMVDFLRMLLGEPVRAAVLGGAKAAPQSSVKGDTQFAAALTLANGAVATLQPLDFEAYREVGVDIWGRDGRLSILQEGLGAAFYLRTDNRALSGAHEVASDQPQILPATAGDALWEVYDNLAQALAGKAALASPGASALATDRIVEALVSASQSGNFAPVAPA